MAKKSGTTIYKCSSCGYSQPRWLGRCPSCGQWNSLEECVADPNALTPLGRGSETQAKARPVPLDSVGAQEEARLPTGIDEFDRTLGGGAAKRSAILIGGEPGIGKSTLLLQTASRVAGAGRRVLYVSGEESAAQIKERAVRMGLPCANIELLSAMRLEDALDAMDALNPALVIIDSIQTTRSVEAGLIPGTVGQLKFCANELTGWVKERDSVLMMTAHVTKDGSIAGPKSLEHMVDTVISFERASDEFRFLRANKNRFGSVDEIGIFRMTEKGLEEVPDPSALFITRRDGRQPAGVACAAALEGSRAFMVEIQALTVTAKASLSRVYSDKIDSARVARVAAVLEKQTGAVFSDQDLYINVAGGMRINESAVDAALAAALYSARSGAAIGAQTAVIGELSLAGEIRPVPREALRVKTAQSMGFKKIIAPGEETGAQSASDIKSLVKILFDSK